MDTFAYAAKVRLRSIHGKYLCAGGSVQSLASQRRRHRHHGEVEEQEEEDSSLVWEVKQVIDAKRGGRGEVKLRSCYGGYLTGSQHKFLLGLTGSKVGQTRPTRADDLSDWEPIHANPSSSEHHHFAGGFIKLRSRAGTFLRANGGAPPWRNTVTHDHSSSDDEQHLLWEVEIVKEIGYE